MTAIERREEIYRTLCAAKRAVPARELAARCGVSRQVVVQDMAVIRASHPGIVSTNYGYVLQQAETGNLREFKVCHLPERTEEELNLFVDYGGHVKNISICHRVYGRITAEMDIHSRQDVREFLGSAHQSTEINTAETVQ